MVFASKAVRGEWGKLRVVDFSTEELERFMENAPYQVALALSQCDLDRASLIRMWESHVVRELEERRSRGASPGQMKLPGVKGE